MTNNPPDIVLELTRKQAEFLARYTLSGWTGMLSMVPGIKDRETAEAMIGIIEDFKAIHNKLKDQGIDPDC